MRGLAEAERGQTRGSGNKDTYKQNLKNIQTAGYLNALNAFGFFKLTTIFAIVEDTGGTAAPGKERQRWSHQPVDDAALPWTQCKTTGCGQ